MSDEQDQQNRWHLDKRVPIAMMAALAMHLGSSVWFFRGLVAEVSDAQRRVAHLESGRVSERLAVVEAQTADTKAATLRIDANVLRLVEAGRAPK